MLRTTVRVLSAASLATALFAGASEPAAAGVITSAVSAVINRGGPGFGNIADTYNQNGLSFGYTSGVTDFATYLAGKPEHTDVLLGFEWFSNEDTTSAKVVYDLGIALTLAGLALWNEESSGIGRLDLYSSLDGVTFTPLSLRLVPTDNPAASYSAEVFSFAATSARYVRFNMSNCPQPDPGSFTACAIGEVAFDAAAAIRVPEPASFSILGLGLLGLGLSRWQRAGQRR